MTIKEAQHQVDLWISNIGIRYFNELTNLAILMEEVGEFSRHISRTYGEQSYKSGENPNDLKKEMGDIFFVLICLANQMGISLEECLQMALDKNSSRDSLRHKQNPKLQP